MRVTGTEWVSVSLLVLVGSAYLWEIASLSGVPFARDMQMFFLPQKHLLWEALRSGELPFWTPHVGTGAPFLANFQAGVFYPPNWLFAALPFFAGFNALVVCHFLLGGVSAYLLGRTLRLGAVAALAGALTWMLGGYFASLLNLMNALQAAAWAPALAASLVAHLDRRSAGSWFLVVLVATLALLAGEPQTFLLAGLVAAVTGVLHVSRHPTARCRPLRLAVGLAAAGVVVLGLVGVQLLPTIELLGHSSRQGGLSFEEASTFSLEPIRLIHLLVPTDFRDPEFSFGLRSAIGRGDPWLFSIYLGPVWLLLFWFAWRNDSRRRDVAVWSVLGLVGLVVALGAHTPLFPFLFERVPGFGSFRFPEKFFFLTSFGAALIAGCGAEALLERRGGRGDRIAATLLLAGLLGVRFAFALGRAPLEKWAARWQNPRMMGDFDFAYGVWGANLTKLLIIATIGVLLIALHRRRAIRARAFGGLLVGLLATDLLIAHRDLNPVVERGFYEATPLVAGAMSLDDVRRRHRYQSTDLETTSGRFLGRSGAALELQKWWLQQLMIPNVGQRFHVLAPDAWDAIKLEAFEDARAFYEILEEPWRRWRLLRLHSVKYVYSEVPLSTEGEAHPLELDPALPGHLYRLNDPLARAYVVPRAVRVPDPVAAINTVLGLDFDASRTVALVDSTAPAGTEPGPARAGGSPGSARIVHEDWDGVRVRLDYDGHGFLVLTDTYYPGWSALVDGQERPIELANFFFRAVEVRPGDREVVFRFRSRSFETGAWTSAATLGLLVAGMGGAGIASLRRRGGRGGGRVGVATNSRAGAMPDSSS